MPRSDTFNAITTETLVATAARTASGNSDAIKGWGSVRTIRAQLEVTAASGVIPTLDVFIEDTLDGETWNTLASFTRRTGTGREVVNITTPFSDVGRVRWAIAGTAPSFTFSVKACS